MRIGKSQVDDEGGKAGRKEKGMLWVRLETWWLSVCQRKSCRAIDDTLSAARRLTGNSKKRRFPIASPRAYGYPPGGTINPPTLSRPVDVEGRRHRSFEDLEAAASGAL